MTYRVIIFLVLGFGVSSPFSFAQEKKNSAPQAEIVRDTSLVVDRLIPAAAAMDRAWEIPRNPLIDTASLPEDGDRAEQIRQGFKIFMQTPTAAKRISRNAIACNNCHPNGGQREKGMPLVGLSTIYPEYNKRAGRMFSLEDRIIECFLRSCNSSAALKKEKITSQQSDLWGRMLSADAPEVADVSAYISWLSNGYRAGDTLPWRGHNVLPARNLLPIGKLNTKLGEKLFLEKCSTCHGTNGQGVDIGDKRAGPLWGSNSWNDGAGAARTYTLAGIIRYMMPYLDPGNLTDEEAQHIAAYITAKPRPAFPSKERDYVKEPIPVDAVYYSKLYPNHPLRKGK